MSTLFFRDEIMRGAGERKEMKMEIYDESPEILFKKMLQDELLYLFFTCCMQATLKIGPNH